MVVWFARTLLSLPVILLVGCYSAPVFLPTPEDQKTNKAQSELWIQAFNENAEKQAHIAGLAYPLLVANSDLCGSNVVNDIGIQWIVFNDIVGVVGRFAAINLGISHNPYLTVVTPGSPAAKAGLQEGDTLLSLNGSRIGKDRNWVAWVDNTRLYRWRFNRFLNRALSQRSSITVQYRRGTEIFQTDIQPVRRCDFDVFVIEYSFPASKTDGVAVSYSEFNPLNSISYGGTILISSGLYEWAQTDRELQMFIAHELAHEIVGHRVHATKWLIRVEPLKRAGLLGDFGRGGLLNFPHPTTPRRYDQTQEQDADYLAMYLLARATIDVSEYANIWTLIPDDAPIMDTHGTLENRRKVIESTLVEIEGKMDADLPLDPNLPPSLRENGNMADAS